MICNNFKDSVGSELLNQSTITLSDKGSRVTARFENAQKKAVLKVRLDGQYFVQTSSCDYLMVLCDLDKCWLIELKGADLNKAYRQLLISLNRLLDKLQKANELIAVAVVTRVALPNYRTPEYLKLKRKLDHYFRQNQIIVQGKQYSAVL